MKVDVCKSHIENGVTKDSHACMIADAIKEACPILVDLQTIRWTDKDKGVRYTYLTPAVAQHNLLKFDQGKPVAPFTFSLSKPAHVRAKYDRRGTTNSYQRRGEKRPRRTKSHLAKYAYLAANRARNYQREREFGLRKFVA